MGDAADGQPNGLNRRLMGMTGQRRRRVAILGLTAVGLAVGVSACSSPSAPPAAPHQTARHVLVIPAAATTASPASRSVRAHAARLRGHGELAFVAGRRLYLVGGPERGLRRVGLAGLDATDLAWSHDGHWLAVEASKPPPRTNPYITEPTSVLLLTADGRTVRRLNGHGHSDSLLGWSPRANRVLIDQTRTSGRGGDRLLVTGPRSHTRQIANAGYIDGAAWSPDGREIAASLNGLGPGPTRRDVVEMSPTGSHGRVIATAADDSVWQVAGWWPDGSGVLAWLDLDSSASIAADGLPLYDLGRHGRHEITRTMLVHPSWIAGSAGRDAIAVVAGGDRELTEGRKHVEVCTPRHCHSRPVPVGDIALDPVWDGHRLLMVRDRRVSVGHGFGARYVERVIDSGRITVAGSLRGSTAPQVAADGTVLFLRDDALWLLPPRARHAERLTSALDLDINARDYYGFVPWATTIAWTDAVAGDLLGTD
jgi:dipeptidyl aminopeptidase/acylaminoacyl peptidase